LVGRKNKFKCLRPVGTLGAMRQIGLHPRKVKGERSG